MAFGINEALKRSFPDDDDADNKNFDKNQRPDLLKPFLMGSITGCCSALVLLPSEVIKAKTQVVVGNKGASSSDIYKQMMRKQGIKSMFCGLDSQLMRDGPFYAVFFG
eukprot:243254_1